MNPATWVVGGTRLAWRVVDPPCNARALSNAWRSLNRHARLALVMAQRDLRTRHAGNMLGPTWVLAHPLFQLGLFVFLFGFVFQQKIGGTMEMPRDYTTYILSGLVPWLAMVPVFTTSATAISANANLIKQFSFEAEVLALKEVVLSMVLWAVGVTLLLVYQVAAYGSIPWTYLLIPLVLAMHTAIMVGVALALSAVGVFLRDVRELMVLAASAGIYLLPVVYLPTWVPAMFRPLLYANPFSYLIWAYQDVFYFGRIEHPWAWLVTATFSALCLALGYRVFARLKPMFGNAL